MIFKWKQLNEQIFALKKRYDTASSKQIENEIERYEVKKKAIIKKKRATRRGRKLSQPNLTVDSNDPPTLRSAHSYDTLTTISLSLTKSVSPPDFITVSNDCCSPLSLTLPYIPRNDTLIATLIPLTKSISSPDFITNNNDYYSSLFPIMPYIPRNDTLIATFISLTKSVSPPDFTIDNNKCCSSLFSTMPYTPRNDTLIATFIPLTKMISPSKENIFNNPIDAESLLATYENASRDDRRLHEKFIALITAKNPIIMLIDGNRRLLNKKPFVHVQDFAMKTITLTPLLQKEYLEYEVLTIFLELIVKDDPRSQLITSRMILWEMKGLSEGNCLESDEQSFIVHDKIERFIISTFVSPSHWMLCVETLFNLDSQKTSLTFYNSLFTPIWDLRCKKFAGDVMTILYRFNKSFKSRLCDLIWSLNQGVCE